MVENEFTWGNFRAMLDETCEDDRLLFMEVNKIRYDIVGGYASMEKIGEEIRDCYTIMLLPSQKPNNPHEL